MTRHNKDPKQGEKNLGLPQTGELAKQEEREKAEMQEVAGRHKNDGQKPHKARR